MPAYKLKVTLHRTKPTVDRTIAVPMDTTFEELAGIIVDAFGWSGTADHSFAADYWRVRIRRPAVPMPMEPNRLDERVARLSDFEGKSLTFFYGDDEEWRHDIRFLKPLEGHCGEYPEIVKYRGACLPEDCGGPTQYYIGMGLDPDADGWEGVLVEADPEDIAEANQYFANEWSRADPVLDLRLDHTAMADVANALKYPETESVLDVELRRVVAVGGGKGELGEDALRASPERYLPVAPVDAGFPYTAIRAEAAKFGYREDLETPEQIRRFESKLRGAQRRHYDAVMRTRSLEEAERWALRNRVTYDAESLAIVDPQRDLDAIVDAVRRLADDARSREDRTSLQGRTFMCPKCGARCPASVDTSMKPDRISGFARHPAVMRCNGCGTTTVLRMMNDGFHVGYSYDGIETPAEFCEGIIAGRIAADGAKDRTARVEALVDLAWEYRMLNRVLEASRTMRRARDLVGPRGWKSVPSVRLRAVALLVYMNEDSKEVRQEVREIKRTLGRRGGLWEAVFAAVCCVRTRDRKEGVELYRLTNRLLEACDPDDRLVYLARLVSVVGFCNTSWETGSPEGMDASERLLSDLCDRAEARGFDTETLLMLCKLYSGMMELFCGLGELERGLRTASMMHGRFAKDPENPIRGLHATIVYVEGLFNLTTEGGDVGRGVACLEELSELVTGLRDNGPYAVERAMVALPLMIRHGSAKAARIDALKSFTSLEPDPKQLFEYLTYYIPAVSGVRTRKQIEDELAAAHIELPPHLLDEMVGSPFDPSTAWKLRFVREF